MVAAKDCAWSKSFECDLAMTQTANAMWQVLRAMTDRERLDPEVVVCGNYAVSQYAHHEFGQRKTLATDESCDEGLSLTHIECRR